MLGFTKIKRKSGMTSILCRRYLKKGDRVFFFNSKLKLFLRKHKSRWFRPYIVISVTLFGAIGSRFDCGKEFKVNDNKSNIILGRSLTQLKSLN